MTPAELRKHFARLVATLSRELLDLPSKVIQNGVIIGIFILIGIVLVWNRFLFMQLAPFVAKHAKTAAVFVNALIEVIWLMFEAIKLVVGTIINIVRTLSGKSTHGPSLKAKPDHYPISAEEIRHFCLTVPVKCHDYTWANSDIITWPLRRLLSPSVCPVLRYCWPVPWLYDLALPVLGWLSYDAVPVIGGNNCNPTDDDEWICVILGVGFLILELIVPFLIFVLILMPLVLTTLGELFWMVDVAVALTIRLALKVEHALIALGSKIESLIAVN